MAFHIIGDPDTILGYRFAGVTGTPVQTVEQARDALAAALKDASLQVVLLTEPVAAQIEPEVTAHRLSTEPPYLVVVGDIWNTPARHKSLEQTIHEAVGIKVVK